jgi:hypothetical protein
MACDFYSKYKFFQENNYKPTNLKTNPELNLKLIPYSPNKFNPL